MAKIEIPDLKIPKIDESDKYTINKNGKKVLKPKVLENIKKRLGK